MENENEIELVLEPLETEAPVEEVSVKEPEITVEDGIAELKAKLEEERAARLAAEQREKLASEQANAAKVDATDSNMKLIDNAIETVKRNADILKQNLRDANAAGDYDAVTEIQLSIIEAQRNLEKLNAGKQQYEAQVRQQQAAPADPVEKLASSLTPRSAEWIRRNPDYARNPNLFKKMVAAHEIAVADGIVPDTDEYFASVESTLKMQRIVNNEQESAMSAASAPVQRRSAPPAAPVSRSGNGTGGQPSSSVISLTRAEREAARDMGMTDKEYAMNKRALMQSGRMN